MYLCSRREYFLESDLDDFEVLCLTSYINCFIMYKILFYYIYRIELLNGPECSYDSLRNTSFQNFDCQNCIIGATISLRRLKNMGQLTGLQRRRMRLYIKTPLKIPIEPVINVNQQIKWLKQLVVIYIHTNMHNKFSNIILLYVGLSKCNREVLASTYTCICWSTSI